MKSNCSNDNTGFTLVELLVVISVVSILAGALFVVLNPVTMQRKAKEAVVASKTSQMCLALNSCGAVKTDARNCDTWLELGLVNTSGDPPGSTYLVGPGGGPVGSADATVPMTGAYGTCSYTCFFAFSNGDIGALTKGAGCL